MATGKAIAPLSQPQAVRMNGIYRTQRHVYDLTRKYYLLGRDRLIDGLQPGETDRILEIGCGTGRNLALAARRWPGRPLIGVDISSAMLETARATLSRQRLDGQILLVEADACALSVQTALAGQSFERIFFSYTLSMIPAWEYALEEALGMLAPRGSLHIVDFGQQERLPSLFRALLFGWLRRFHVHPRADLHAVLEEAALRHKRTLTFRAPYRGYAWSAVLA